MSQTKQTFKQPVTHPAKLNYWLHLPKDYRANGEPWPVILFLHGAGERGSNMTLAMKHGIPKLAAHDPSLPFICISPQCPKHSWWILHLDELMALVDDVLATHNADRNRVYLTGMSMGGNGTWGLAYRYPDRFAAIAPICGHDLFITGVTENPAKLKHLPIWAFHGAADPIVPIHESAALCDELRHMGADVQFTVYPYADHDSWSETYSNPDFYQWLLKYRLSGEK